MATVTANMAQSAISPRFSPPQGGNITVLSIYSGTVTLVATDVVQMLKVPDGAVIHDVAMWTQNSVNEGSLDNLYTIGDGGVAARFVAAGGQTSNSVTTQIRLTNRVGLPVIPGYEYTIEDTMDITVDTFGATAGGTVSPLLVLQVTYSTDQLGTTGG